MHININAETLHHPTNMTDIFMPLARCSAQELRLLMSVRYVADVQTDGNLCKVKVISWEEDSKPEIEDPIVVPASYHIHLQHFIWRQHLFMGLVDRANSVTTFKLRKGLRPILQRYIEYMDGMVEGLLTSVKRNPDPAFRSKLFDLYLVTDYYLEGRHEYDVGDTWRLEHPDTILECVQMDTIGKALQ